MAAGMKLSGKVLALLAGTVTAAGGGYLLVNNTSDTTPPAVQQGTAQPAPSGDAAPKEPETKAAEDPAAKPSEQVASLPETKPEAKPEVSTADPKLPTFDVLRVEKDGSVVIAGSGPANSLVEIMEGDEVLANSRSGADGEFAIVFEKPLAAGDHELMIRATPDGGAPVLSAEVGIVTIPQAGDAKGEVLAMVQEQGEATRILQAPQIDQPAAENNVVTENKEVASNEPAKAETGSATQAAKEPASEPASGAQAVETKEQPPSGEAAPVVKKDETTILVQAVDVEPNKVFIAGLGEPNRTARIYIDDTLKGTIKIRPNGSFLFELSEGLAVGTHNLRIDSLSADGSQVASRAAVMIDHSPEEPPVAVAEAQPEKNVAENQENKAAAAETAAQAVDPVPQKAEEVKPAETAPAVEGTAKPAETAAAEASGEVPVIKTGRSVIIRRGDNLWRISRRMLGAGRKYTVIFSANESQIKNPNRIYPGQVFDIPETEPEDGKPVAEGTTEKAG